MKKSFRVYSDVALGEYSFKVTKIGDGDFYANLPTLYLVFDPRANVQFSFSQPNMNVYMPTSDDM